MRNKFIVLEGIDGSGKSTLASNLSNYIQTNLKKECIILEEPTKTGKYGIEIRKILKSNTQDNQQTGKILLDLFLKDRIWDITTRIQPVLQENKIVILDRYYFSTAAYQAHSFEETNIIINSYLENKNILSPDILFYVDLKPKDALKRMNTRNKQTEIFEVEESLNRIYNQYNYIFNNFKFEFSIKKINGNQTQKELLKNLISFL